ncbi:MAG: transposase [Tepidisphaeraceae bacterium]
MVRWYHAIFTAYGFWLPNDPRGSWSTFVGSWELFKFGPATKTNLRRSLARDPHDSQLRKGAKKALKYPPVRFDAAQRDCIALGIAQACGESNIQLLACAIGFDHVHVVVARHAKSIELVVGQFKGRATQRMRIANCHPLQRFARNSQAPPTPWAERCWSVYINDHPQLRSAIRYVERHPQKEGLRKQDWWFVTPAVTEV